MSREWSLASPPGDVLDALSIWLEAHPEWEYRLTFRADYLNKNWHACLRHEVNGSEMVINGRGDTAHEATIDAFQLADVPRP